MNAEDIEQTLTRLCRDVLKVAEIPPGRDLFELGVSSLQIISIIYLLREELSAEFGLEILVEGADVRGIARRAAASPRKTGH